MSGSSVSDLEESGPMVDVSPTVSQQVEDRHELLRAQLLQAEQKVAVLTTRENLLEGEVALVTKELETIDGRLERNCGRRDKKLRELKNLRAISWKFATWMGTGKNAPKIRALQNVTNKLDTIIEKNSLDLLDKLEEQLVLLRLLSRVQRSILEEKEVVFRVLKDLTDNFEPALV